MWKKQVKLVLIFTLLFSLLVPVTAKAETVTLFTPYSGIAVTPGERLSYNIDVNNDTAQVQRLQLQVENLAQGWEYRIRSGGFAVQELSVYPGESERFTLEVEVPLQVERGQYAFQMWLAQTPVSPQRFR
jgi:uncharacterized membrane protein